MLKKLASIAFAMVTGLYGAAESVYVIIDVSDSNRVIKDHALAKRSAEHIYNKITTLEKGSITQMYYVGMYNTLNSSSEIKISRKNTAQKVAFSLAKKIINISNQDIAHQGQTNIVTKLYEISERIDSNYKTTIYILSDMIEYSDGGFNLYHLKQPYDWSKTNANTPGLLKGVDIIIYGAGLSSSTHSEYINLKQSWKNLLLDIYEVNSLKFYKEP